MVNKLLLNNELLANKKNVQKAKIVAINKLVQKIRKLKILAEKKPNDVKIQEKILKTSEVLACAKKLKNTEILKKALTNDKNPVTIITNGRSFPEEIAEAILFDTKQIIDIVKHIKDLLSLNDEISPGWKDKILELSKKKQKQLRTDYKKEIRQQRKERHQLTVKREEWLQENLPENLLKNDNPIETEESHLMDISESKNISKPDKKSKLLSKDIKVKKPKKVLSKNEKPVNKIKKDIKQKLDNIKKVDTQDSEGELEIVKSIDPFFVTQNGDNYLSTVVIDRVQPDGPNDGMVRKERRAYQNGGGGNRKQQIRNNNYFNNNKNISSSKMQTLETKNKWKNKNVNQNKMINNKEIDKTEEELHPSWACKQKERGIKEFSGKKIVFGESESGKLIEKIISKPENENNKIHPSWEAKQKQKGIKPFSGKKTTFENNDNNYKENPNKKIDSKSEEKLHPSWEAKQKLKPVISEFKGTKIIFDD